MHNMGIFFKIPNEYGKFLSDLLVPIPYEEYQWLVDNTEIHVIEKEEFTNEFLFNDDRLMDGEKLYNIAKGKVYYLIFVTLRAFLKEGKVFAVKDYKEFLESDCQMILSVVDCSDVMILCKDSQILDNIIEYAISKGYSDTRYISHDELIEKKYYID